MFEGKSIFEILQMGGFSIYILLFCSIVSIAIMINRITYFMSLSKVLRYDYLNAIRVFLQDKNPDQAKKYVESTTSIFSPLAALSLGFRQGNTRLRNALDREINLSVVGLERYITILGTIGNISLYIGLFGTIVGIIRAFHNISMQGTGGITVVIGGVAEALLTTAAGLFVAIPAVAAYNFFVKKIDIFANEMELFASELLEIISETDEKN